MLTDNINNKLIFTFYTAFLSFISGCEKEKEQTPSVKPTYYGKITCLFNGQEWQSETGGSILISFSPDICKCRPWQFFETPSWLSDEVRCA